MKQYSIPKNVLFANRLHYRATLHCANPTTTSLSFQKGKIMTSPTDDPDLGNATGGI